MHKEKIPNFIKENYSTTLELLRTLCHIPAPSNKEEARADFSKNWLEQNGAEGVYIDKALNVVYL